MITKILGLIAIIKGVMFTLIPFWGTIIGILMIIFGAILIMDNKE